MKLSPFEAERRHHSSRTSLYESLLLAILVTAQLLFLGPIYVLITNSNDITIPVYDAAKLLGGITVLATIPLFLVLWLVGRSKLHRFTSLTLSIGIYLYLQFYFFVWDYGIFDGASIDWSEKNHVLFIELPTLAILVILSIFVTKKFLSYGFLALAILFLGEAAITGLTYLDRRALLSNDVPRQAGSASDASSSYFSTDIESLKRANQLSTNRNVIIILVDTLQSDIFEKIVQREASVKETLEGFVLYRNSAGLFPYTTLTVPALFTGRSYKPGENIPEYYAKIAKLRIDSSLANKGFTVSAIPLGNRVRYLDARLEYAYALANLLDVSIFRHAPHYLKPLVFNNHRFLLRPMLGEIPTSEPAIDLAVLDALVASSEVDGEKDHFKFLHFWGMHPPGMLDCDCKPAEASHERSAVENQAECVLKKVGRYLTKIKQLGVYDRSLIFLLADTGSKYAIQGDTQEELAETNVPDFVISSAHPVIAMKDFRKRGELQMSNVPVSLLDVPTTVLRALRLDGHETDGLDILSIRENYRRARSFFYYKNPNEAYLPTVPQMQEFKIDGFIRKKSSWSVAKTYFGKNVDQETMSGVDFGDPDSSKFHDLAWSAEAAGYHVSWTLAKTASLTGKLPSKKTLRMVVKLLNPHANQKLEVRVNGRPIVTWKIDKPHDWREYKATFDLPEKELGQISRVDFDVAKSGFVGNTGRRLGICVDWVRFE